MMRGWFDLFRDNGGPTLYAYSNRTSVIGDLQTLYFFILFATLFLAFLIVFPGIRKERFTTFTSVALSLFVGSSIVIGNHGNSWHVAEAEISSAYRAFSNEKVMGKIGVYVGLVHVNITLEAMPIYYNKSMDINFNERFHWDGPTQLKEEYREALVKGLPFPILTVAEYFAIDAEGFCWGRTYREAGYYTSIFLWAALSFWILMNLLFVVVPRYGAYMMTATGLMMLFCNAIYYWLLPSRPLLIRMEDVQIRFELGWCYWLVLCAGILCLLMGASISIIDLMYPHKFSTVVEMDYGTPFDRHIIIEDSHETKKRKKTIPRLEEPQNTTFTGLLRRLSKRTRERHDIHDLHHNPSGPDSVYFQGSGHDNYAFEMEAPKSPWRYPHLMFRSDSRKTNKSVSFKQGKNHLDIPAFGGAAGGGGILRRTDSKDSDCSSLSSVPHADVRASLSVPPFQDQFHKRFRRTDSAESSGSSLASFGLSLLSRNGSKKAGGVAAQSVVRTDPSVPPLERNDSDMSSVSRGYTVQDHVIANVPQQQTSKADEVSIVVSTRKDSITNAVRRSSAEQQRSEAAMW